MCSSRLTVSWLASLGFCCGSWMSAKGVYACGRREPQRACGFLLMPGLPEGLQGWQSGLAQAGPGAAAKRAHVSRHLGAMQTFKLHMCLQKALPHGLDQQILDLLLGARDFLSVLAIA